MFSTEHDGETCTVVRVTHAADEPDVTQAWYWSIYDYKRMNSSEICGNNLQSKRGELNEVAECCLTPNHKYNFICGKK